VALKILEIIKKDGKVVPVDIAENSKVMVDASQMGENIYNPDSKILKVNIPGLEVGDMLRYVTFRNDVKARVPNTWSDYELFEYTSPIKHSVVEIKAPNALPLSKIQIKDAVKGTVTSDVKQLKNAVRYRWIVKDVPRMFEEPNMPSLHSVVQRLLVSTIKEWKDVSKWYWKLSKPHLEKITPDMRDKVLELTADARTETQKIDAIFRFVSQKISYMGIISEKEAPGYEPHDVDLTFKNKFGVCRDKAALLVSMLRIAGLKAFPVLIMVGPKKDPDVPNPYFNHAITAVEKKDGDYILMDPTDENTRVLFPAYLCNKSYLVAKPQGDVLRTSPVIPAENNLMQITTHASVNDTGLMSAETTLRFSGINDGAYRGFLAKIKPVARKHFFQKTIKKVFPGAKFLAYDIQPKNIQDTSQALKVHMRYIAENTLIKGDGKALLPPPWIGTSVGMVNFVLGKTGLEKRKYPLVTDIACGVRENFTIDLKHAVGANIAIPAPQSIDEKSLAWYQNFDFKNKILSGKSEFILKNVEFSPKEYSSLKDALKKIELNRRKTPIFYKFGISKVTDKMVAGNADIATLDEKVHYKVVDNFTWEVTRTIRKKILTYAGKEKFSKLKFKYNPAWEDITVKFVKVIQKNGVVKRVGKDETNLMDAEWVGSAPRYPETKILVLNLPGVDIGSVIEYSVLRKYTHRPFFSMMEFFQGFNPVFKKSVTLEAPETMPVKISTLHRPGNKVFVYKNDKAGEYVWKGTNATALKKEKNLPPPWAFIPSCVVSSGDWKRYANKVSSTLDKAAQNQPKTTAVALRLINGVKDPLKKIQQIRNFVDVNIKKAGPGLSELPLTAITPADKTLTDGYGDSADRAVVLYAMLLTAGFHPDFVIASNYARIDQLKRLDTVPQNGKFNEVLVHILYKPPRADRILTLVHPQQNMKTRQACREFLIKKRNLYLNDTDQYAALGSSAHEGKTALFCSSGKIDKITLDPKMNDRADSSYRIKIDDKGDAFITCKRTFYGTDYDRWKKKYKEISHEERIRHYQELAADISQSAVPAGKLKTEFSKYPGVETFSVSVKNFAVLEDKYLYLKLPGSLQRVLGLHADLRENPFLFNDATRNTRSYLLTLPKEYAGKIAISPDSETWKLPSGAGSIAIITDKDQNKDNFGTTAKPDIVIQQKVDIKPALISRHDFNSILMISSRIDNQKNQTLLMEKRHRKDAE